ncbi:MAG: sialidase family protein [Myxococcota bacterium]
MSTSFNGMWVLSSWNTAFGMWLLLLVCSLSLSPDEAWAHGRFPESVRIEFDPAHSGRIGVGTTFGILITEDNGLNWTWICREALDITLNEDPPFSFLAGDTILATTFRGLVTGSASGCGFRSPSAVLGATIVIDVFQTAVDEAFVLTSPGNAPNEVFATRDGGESFSALPVPIAEAGYLSERVRASGDVIYVSGAKPASAKSPREARVYRSEDRGVSWVGTPFELREGERNIFLLGVDPQNTDHLLMQVAHHNDFEVPDRLVESRDGGKSWQDRWTAGTLRGFAWDQVSGEIWVGGTDPSILAVSRDGGMTFETVRDDLQIGCLAVREDELWACAQNWIDGFSVGKSTDGGLHFEPQVVFDTTPLEPVVCASDPATTESCAEAYPDLEQDLGLAANLDDGGVTDGGLGDSGTVPPEDDASSGCSAVGRIGFLSALWPIALWLIVLWLGVRRLGPRARTRRVREFR